MVVWWEYEVGCVRGQTDVWKQHTFKVETSGGFTFTLPVAYLLSIIDLRFRHNMCMTDKCVIVHIQLTVS